MVTSTVNSIYSRIFFALYTTSCTEINSLNKMLQFLNIRSVAPVIMLKQNMTQKLTDISGGARRCIKNVELPVYNVHLHAKFTKNLRLKRQLCNSRLYFKSPNIEHEQSFMSFIIEHVERVKCEGKS